MKNNANTTSSLIIAEQWLLIIEIVYSYVGFPKLSLL